MKKFPSEITIDPEFAGLIPAISEKEFAQLEKNILEDGLREPLTGVGGRPQASSHRWAQPTEDLE